MIRHRVFVYGTLKHGFPNHHLSRGHALPGRWQTRLRYPLYLVGERASPWLIDAAGDGERVLGEVHELDDAALQALDRLERTHEPDGYRRQRIRVADSESQQELEVWAWLKPADALDSLPRDTPVQGPFAEYELSLAAYYRPRHRSA